MRCRNCVNLKCDWCDIKADSPDPDMERDCRWFAQKTNADHIRAMSDEELADYLWSVKKYDRSYDKHISSWLRWLRSPVEVDNG